MKPKTLLVIKSSIFSSEGQSSLLANRFTADWRASNPQAKVIERDLALDPVPHLTGERFAAFLAKSEDRTLTQVTEVMFSDRLINELQQTDVVVFALPMYNLGVPSTLKAYFDHVARIGMTFRYTDKGPVGLLTDKKVYVLATRGGIYAGTARDTETPHMREVLGLMGITDIEFVYAEGLAVSPEQKGHALADAYSQIGRLLQSAGTT